MFTKETLSNTTSAILDDIEDTEVNKTILEDIQERLKTIQEQQTTILKRLNKIESKIED